MGLPRPLGPPLAWGGVPRLAAPPLPVTGGRACCSPEVAAASVAELDVAELQTIGVLEIRRAQYYIEQ